MITFRAHTALLKEKYVCVTCCCIHENSQKQLSCEFLLTFLLSHTLSLTHNAEKKLSGVYLSRCSWEKVINIFFCILFCEYHFEDYFARDASVAHLTQKWKNDVGKIFEEQTSGVSSYNLPPSIVPWS